LLALPFGEVWVGSYLPPRVFKKPAPSGEIALIYSLLSLSKTRYPELSPAAFAGDEYNVQLSAGVAQGFINIQRQSCGL